MLFRFSLRFYFCINVTIETWAFQTLGWCPSARGADVANTGATLASASASDSASPAAAIDRKRKCPKLIEFDTINDDARKYLHKQFFETKKIHTIYRFTQILSIGSISFRYSQYLLASNGTTRRRKRTEKKERWEFPMEGKNAELPPNLRPT